MKILLLSKYSRLGASSRLRTMQFLPGLIAAGFEIRVQSLFDDTYLQQLYQKKGRSLAHVLKCYWHRLLVLFQVKQFDVVWLEYELLPYFPAWLEKYLKWRKVRFVVDYDDALFHNYDMSGNPVLKNLLGTKIDQVMANADVVCVGNSYLKERALKAGAQVIHWVPTVIDLDRYPAYVRLEKPANPVFGWIGSPATQSYLTMIAPALSKVVAECDGRLILIGANSDILPHFSGCQVELRQWSEATEVSDICSFDVGLMPLPDGPWERGKCGYKLIQYMACAVPVIASPVGANIDIVQGSEAGLLASTDDQWKDALMSLASNPALRQHYGRSGRKAVENVYSLQAQLPELKNIFSSLQRISTP